MPTGWQGKRDTRPLPPDWPERRAWVLARDAHRCQHVREDTQAKCLAWGRDVDHIIERSDGGSDHVSNLQVLCSYHHARKTGQHAGLRSQRVQSARRRKRAPKHPGLMR